MIFRPIRRIFSIFSGENIKQPHLEIYQNSNEFKNRCQVKTFAKLVGIYESLVSFLGQNH
ncbi:MAG: hypothetical protein DSZ24_02530 [Thermodesulfatator sp.]|nr:MAG: hypothetical protein DSZ24_02530 [Thermodesulfatator sp.]